MDEINFDSDDGPFGYREEEEPPLSDEELKKEMHHDLVQINIITKEDLEKSKEKQEIPEEDRFVKVTDYLLEKSKSYFVFFKGNYAHYEAVKIARQLVKDGIIIQHEKKYSSTTYYFEEDDIKTMKSIDSQLIKYFPEGHIPIKSSFLDSVFS